MAKRGTLVVKDFYDLGAINGVKLTIEALCLYEPGQEKDRIRGLRVEVSQYRSGLGTETHASFLDLDEAESLSQALGYLIELGTKWANTDREYTEVTFSTKDEFQIGFYQSGREQKAFASSGTVGKTSAFFDMAKLSDVKATVDKGLALLGNK